MKRVADFFSLLWRVSALIAGLMIGSVLMVSVSTAMVTVSQEISERAFYQRLYDQVNEPGPSVFLPSDEKSIYLDGPLQFAGDYTRNIT